MTKLLVKLYYDVGRMGEVEGLFILTDKELNFLKSRGEICFGEILGKHSEVFVPLTDKTLKVLSDDQPFIDKLETVLGADLFIGHNPMDYIDQFEGWEDYR